MEAGLELLLKASVELNKAQAQLDAAIRRANVDVKSAFMQVDTDRAKLEARKAAMDSSALVSQASKQVITKA